jgi:membrane-bound inhibitor of C-type lysozyme
MRILLTGIAALALSGCHAAAPDNGSAASGPQPNEAVIENQFASQQAALAASIENDANSDDSDDDNDSGDGAKSYSCDNNLAVTVTYTDSGNATLVSGGKTLALKAIPAASGAKYHADTGLDPGRSLTWWTKGDGAMLIQGPKGAKEGATGETMANCLATDPDQ